MPPAMVSPRGVKYLKVAGTKKAGKGGVQWKSERGEWGAEGPALGKKGKQCLKKK